jgi:hypothetical protein
MERLCREAWFMNRANTILSSDEPPFGTLQSWIVSIVREQLRQLLYNGLALECNVTL